MKDELGILLTEAKNDIAHGNYTIGATQHINEMNKNLCESGIRDEIKNPLSAYVNVGTPAFATLIIKNNETVFKNVSGCAVLENDKCVLKATLDTPFAICSLTKHFTAAAILMLEENGLLSTDDEISKYIPQLSTDFAGIKIRHLIFHISGIPNYTDNPDFLDINNKLKNNIVLDHKATLAHILKLKPVGYSKKFAYSNSGYVLLAEIVQNVSGLSFANFMQEAVFDKLLMTNTFLMADIDQQQNYTQQYNPWPLYTPTNWTKVFHLSGEGGIFMSINDYEKWIKAFENNQIFKKMQTMEKYLSIGKFDDGSDIVDNGVIIGFGIMQREEKRNGETYKVLVHGGGMPGSASFFQKLNSEKDNIWVAYFNNAGSYPSVYDILDQANISY